MSKPSLQPSRFNSISHMMRVTRQAMKHAEPNPMDTPAQQMQCRQWIKKNYPKG
jgi:hypothetical protein